MPNEYRNETDIVLVIKADYCNRTNTVCISFRITHHLYCSDHIHGIDTRSVFVPFPLSDVTVSISVPFPPLSIVILRILYAFDPIKLSPLLVDIFDFSDERLRGFVL